MFIVIPDIADFAKTNIKTKTFKNAIEIASNFPETVIHMNPTQPSVHDKRICSTYKFKNTIIIYWATNYDRMSDKEILDPLADQCRQGVRDKIHPLTNHPFFRNGCIDTYKLSPG